MLLLSVTGLGLAELVTERSAWPAVATTTEAVASLLLGLGSVVDELTLAVSLMTVPAAVPAATLSWKLNVAEPPEARDPVEQVRTLEMTEHDQPTTIGTVTRVVLAGMGSVKATLVAAAAPLFRTTTTSLMLLPASTGFGEFVLVMERSAVVDRPTVVCTVAELLERSGSTVPEPALTTSVITVPAATPVLTATVTVNVVDAPEAKSGLEQEIAPVPPTAGVLQFQPEPPGTVIDWKVVLAGMASLKTALRASRGPLLVTTCVYVMTLPGPGPARTGFGVPELVTAISAEAHSPPGCVPGV